MSYITVMLVIMGFMQSLCVSVQIKYLFFLVRWLIIDFKMRLLASSVFISPPLSFFTLSFSPFVCSGCFSLLVKTLIYLNMEFKHKYLCVQYFQRCEFLGNLFKNKAQVHLQSDCSKKNKQCRAHTANKTKQTVYLEEVLKSKSQVDMN